MKTYTWKSRQFPTESGKYHFKGTIFRSLKTWWSSENVDEKVYVSVEGKSVTWDDQVHEANDCQGDFTGPYPITSVA